MDRLYVLLLKTVNHHESLEVCLTSEAEVLDVKSAWFLGALTLIQGRATAFWGRRISETKMVLKLENLKGLSVLIIDVSAESGIVNGFNL